MEKPDKYSPNPDYTRERVSEAMGPSARRSRSSRGRRSVFIAQRVVNRPDRDEPPVVTVKHERIEWNATQQHPLTRRGRRRLHNRMAKASRKANRR